MTEGEEKKCGQCGIQIIHVKIIDTFENRNTEKLQWQTKSTHKPHFKFAGPGKWKCMTPEEIVKDSMLDHQGGPEWKVDDEPKEVDTTIKVTDPFHEAELITRWADEKAYKIVMAEVSDYSKLDDKKKNSLGQKQGNLTKILADSVLQLMKIHGVKSNYGN